MDVTNTSRGWSDDECLRKALPAVIRGMEFHRQLPSTQDRAAELTNSGCLDRPFLVVAEVQSAGRGRRGHTWWSEIGGLTFSLVLDEQTSPAGVVGRYTLQVALAVRDALARLLPQGVLQVKWPNDVILDGKKVAGILLETLATRPRQIVVGIGINVNNSVTRAPAELATRLTTLSDHAGYLFHLDEVLREVLQELLPIEVHARENDDLPARWRVHCSLTGKHIEVERGATVWNGRCCGIDHDGQLLLDTPSGITRIASGSVR